MAFEDFCTYFTTANVCHVPNTKALSVRKRWRTAVYKGAWKTGKSAGGCINNKTGFFTNPQVTLRNIKAMDKRSFFMNENFYNKAAATLA